MTSALLLLIAAAVPAPAIAAPNLAYFQGNWSCEGHFIRSGKPLASDLEFGFDKDTGQLVKRHIDRAPSTYKSREIWALERDANTYRATIADAYGLRWYTAPGWEGDRFVWSRTGAGEPDERFVYIRKDAQTMTFEWWIARDGAPLGMGDTLNCRRKP